MARGRMLNRRVCRSTKVDKLWAQEGPEAALLWTWLIPWVDINANVCADPLWVWANVVPRASSRGAFPVEKVVATVDAIQEHRLAFKYEVDGMLYLHVPGFWSEQKGLRKDRELAEWPVPPMGMKTKWARFQVMDGEQTTVLVDPIEKPNGVVKLDTLLEHGAEDDWLDTNPQKREVVGWWLDGLRILGHEKPPNPSIHRQGRVAERLAEAYTRRQIARAIVGLGRMFPWCPKTMEPNSPHRPFDLMTLEKHFGTASAAKMPRDQSQDFRDRFKEARR